VISSTISLGEVKKKTKDVYSRKVKTKKCLG